jgi:hypothetical protein
MCNYVYRGNLWHTGNQDASHGHNGMNTRLQSGDWRVFDDARVSEAASNRASQKPYVLFFDQLSSQQPQSALPLPQALQKIVDQRKSMFAEECARFVRDKPSIDELLNQWSQVTITVLHLQTGIASCVGTCPNSCAQAVTVFKTVLKEQGTSGPSPGGAYVASGWFNRTLNWINTVRHGMCPDGKLNIRLTRSGNAKRIFSHYVDHHERSPEGVCVCVCVCACM